MSSSNIGRTPVFSDVPDLCNPVKLNEIVFGIRSLPSLPAVAAYLMRVHDDEIDFNHAIQLMSYDQTLTAKTLRFANSAYFGKHSASRTLVQAVQLIGLRSLRDLISISTLGSMLSTVQCPAFDLPSYWRHSIATASVASSLARAIDVPHGTAFTAGLLHDIGQMVLACTIPDAYTKVLHYQAEHGCSIFDAEVAVIDLDHLEAGAALGHAWKLGDAIVWSISLHHDGPEAFASKDRLPSIVYLANMITHTVDFEKEEMEPVTNEILTTWNEIGLAGKDYGNFIQMTRIDYRKATSMLQL